MPRQDFASSLTQVLVIGCPRRRILTLVANTGPKYDVRNGFKTRRHKIFKTIEKRAPRRRPFIVG